MRKQHLKKLFESNIRKKSVNKQISVRFCLPFSIICLYCQKFTAKYTRFNCTKESFKDFNCYTSERHRFILKCKKCKEFFTIITDLDNGIYIPEEGCLDAESCYKENKTQTNKLNEEITKNKNLHELEINMRKLINIDVDLVIKSLKTNETLESLNRKKILKEIRRFKK